MTKLSLLYIYNVPLDPPSHTIEIYSHYITLYMYVTLVHTLIYITLLLKAFSFN